MTLNPIPTPTPWRLPGDLSRAPSTQPLPYREHLALVLYFAKNSRRETNVQEHSPGCATAAFYLPSPLSSRASLRPPSPSSYQLTIFSLPLPSCLGKLNTTQRRISAACVPRYVAVLSPLHHRRHRSTRPGHEGAVELYWYTLCEHSNQEQVSGSRKTRNKTVCSSFLQIYLHKDSEQVGHTVEYHLITIIYTKL